MVAPYHAGYEDAGADQVVEVVNGAAPHVDLEGQGDGEEGEEKINIWTEKDNTETNMEMERKAK